MKKILFINMPNTVIDNYELSKYTLERQSVSNVPYGILTICSYVKKYAKKDVEFKILDLNDEICNAYDNKISNTKEYTFEKLNKKIEEFKPDIVGISIMFNVSYMYLEEISSAIKGINKDILVMVGGNLATSLYKEITQMENVDCVSYGEGEIPFCELVDSENSIEKINESPAFVTKEKLKAGIAPVNVLLEDLDLLPPIDFSYINLEGYKKPMTRFFQREDEVVGGDPMTLVIYTTRGCPFNCCFCACHIVHGKKVRYMSVEKFLSDVKSMIEQHDIKILMINDDNFLLDKNRAKTILKELIALKLQVVFPSILVRNIDEEIALLLKQVGVTNQLVSIESGSEYVLKNIIEKPLSKDQIGTAVENMRKNGISVDTNVVMGFPGETDEHRQETLETIYNIGFNWSHFLIVLPVAGTNLYKKCKENNYLINDSNFYSPNLSQCNIRTPEYEPEHIEKQAYMMNLHANFVHNYNLRIGNYDDCIVHFSNIIKSVENHAFAYYGLMKAYEGIGNTQLALENKVKFEGIINNDRYWRDWAEYFKLV